VLGQRDERAGPDTEDQGDRHAEAMTTAVARGTTIRSASGPSSEYSAIAQRR